RSILAGGLLALGIWSAISFSIAGSAAASPPNISQIGAGSYAATKVQLKELYLPSVGIGLANNLGQMSQLGGVAIDVGTAAKWNNGLNVQIKTAYTTGDGFGFGDPNMLKCTLDDLTLVSDNSAPLDEGAGLGTKTTTKTKPVDVLASLSRSIDLANGGVADGG